MATNSKDWLFIRIGNIEKGIYPSKEDIRNVRNHLEETGINKYFNIIICGPLFNVNVKSNETKSHVGMCNVERLTWFKKFLLKWIFSYTYR